MSDDKHCLVTGATGYIGSRLVPELLSAGHRVRCLTRNARRLQDQPWAGDVEIVQGDILDEPSLRAALGGVDVAYYLVHSMGASAQFERRDADAARIFARVAGVAGVGRVVYLGGIVPAEAQVLSPHLRSRREVGDILLNGPVPTTVLQAAIIVGSGSASFEMLRYLTDRLPVMITPRWVSTRVQPIAVTDVLRYLVGCATISGDVSRRFDIGGPDVMSYADMMRSYARVAGLRNRFIVRFPLLSPRLSSLWVGLVTPVPAGLARPLVESLRNEVVCTEHDIAAHIPDPPYGLISLHRGIALALRQVRTGDVAIKWASASSSGWSDEQLPSDPKRSDPDWSGGTLYIDDRVVRMRASAGQLWRTIEGIGGDRGWYSSRLAWTARGLLDRMVGGAGLRRGRRDPDLLQVGDPLDFWRVEELAPGSLLRLRAELKLPGRAWLEFSVRRDGLGRTVYRQRAMFRPFGLVGQVYWWATRPFHDLVFGSMLRKIAAEAGRASLAEYARSPESQLAGRRGQRPPGAVG